MSNAIGTMTQTPGLLKELRNLLKKQMASAFERFSASVTKKYDDGTCGLGHTGDSSETFRKYIREMLDGIELQQDTDTAGSKRLPTGNLAVHAPPPSAAAGVKPGVAEVSSCAACQLAIPPS